MAGQMSSTKPIAVLIDAENVQLTALPHVLDKCKEFGVVALRRAYGDFTLKNLANWPEIMSRLAIQPVQQFRIIDGKSLSDSALIIDAMDLLHSGRYGAFCIVSSDSDFTRLAMRIREDGIAVYGFGEKKTHKDFESACDRFIDPKKLIAETKPNGAKEAASVGKSSHPKRYWIVSLSWLRPQEERSKRSCLLFLGSGVRRVFLNSIQKTIITPHWENFWRPLPKDLSFRRRMENPM